MVRKKTTLIKIGNKLDALYLQKKRIWEKSLKIT